MGSDFSGFGVSHNMTLHCKNDLAALLCIDCKCSSRENTMARSACSLLK